VDYIFYWLQDTSLGVVELAALLHDVQDWKYSHSTAAGTQAVQVFLLII
jgi:HD superfamily phosphohydrolase